MYRFIKKSQFNKFNKILFFVFLVIVSLYFVSSTWVKAAPDKVLNYQGQLKDSSNNPITTATTIQFSIYNHPTNGSPSDTPSASGPLLWKQVHDGVTCPQIVPNSDGFFNVLLGECVAFPSYMNFNENYYIGLKIGTNSEATPRLKLSSSPISENVRNITFDSNLSNAFRMGTSLLNYVNFNTMAGVEEISLLQNTVIGSSSSNRLTVNSVLQGAVPLVFEGSTVDAFTTSFAITDPTANRTITFPNASGTVALTSDLITFAIGQDGEGITYSGGIFRLGDGLNITGNRIVTLDPGSTTLEFSHDTGLGGSSSIRIGNGMAMISGSGNGMYNTSFMINNNGTGNILSAHNIYTSRIRIDGAIDDVFEIQSNRPAFRGLTYQNDFSSNFVARSLVDKAYVDNAVSTAGVTLNAAYNFGGPAAGNFINVVASNGNGVEIRTPYDPLNTFSINTGLKVVGDGTGYNTTNSGIAMVKLDAGVDAFGTVYSNNVNNFTSTIYGYQSFISGLGGSFSLGYSNSMSDYVGIVMNTSGLFINSNDLGSGGTISIGAENSFYLTSQNERITVISSNNSNDYAAVDIFNSNNSFPYQVLRLSNINGAIQQTVGMGNPNGIVTAYTGSVYFNTAATSASNALWVKTGGFNNTGWLTLGGGGNLDTAYNFGGPAAGRVINVLPNNGNSVEIRTPFDPYNMFGINNGFVVVGDGSGYNSTSSGFAITKLDNGATDIFGPVYSANIHNYIMGTYGYNWYNNTSGNEFLSLGLALMGGDYSRITLGRTDVNITSNSLGGGGSINVYAHNNIDIQSSTDNINLTAWNTSDTLGTLNIFNMGMTYPNQILRLANASGSIHQAIGNGDPNGIVTSYTGSVYFNMAATSANDALWVKTGGFTSTGWVAMTGLTGNEIFNGGNSFGSHISVGTNDNFGLNLETNGTNRLFISNEGAMTIFNNSLLSHAGTVLTLQNTAASHMNRIRFQGPSESVTIGQSISHPRGFAISSETTGVDLFRVDGNIYWSPSSPYGYNMMIGNSLSNEVRFTIAKNTGSFRFVSDGTYKLRFLQESPATELFGILETNSNFGITSPSITHRLTVTDSTSLNVARFNGSGTTQCTVVAGTGWSCTSDQRLKENISNIVDASSIIKGLRPVSYNWKGNTSHLQYGFIAQEVENILPDIVTDTEDGYKSMQTMGLIPYLVKSQQEQISRIDNIESLLNNFSFDNSVISLSTSITELQNRTTQLENSIASISAEISELSQRINIALALINSTVSGVDIDSVRFNTLEITNSTIQNLNVQNLAVSKLDVIESLRLNNNMAGQVIISPGQFEVRVNFISNYTTTPIINVTPVGDEVLINDISYTIVNSGLNGFTIKINKETINPVVFNWVAFDKIN